MLRIGLVRVERHESGQCFCKLGPQVWVLHVFGTAHVHQDQGHEVLQTTATRLKGISIGDHQLQLSHSLLKLHAKPVYFEGCSAFWIADTLMVHEKKCCFVPFIINAIFHLSANFLPHTFHP